MPRLGPHSPSARSHRAAPPSAPSIHHIKSRKHSLLLCSHRCVRLPGPPQESARPQRRAPCPLTECSPISVAASPHMALIERSVPCSCWCIRLPGPPQQSARPQRGAPPRRPSRHSTSPGRRSRRHRQGPPANSIRPQMPIWQQATPEADAVPPMMLLCETGILIFV